MALCCLTVPALSAQNATNIDTALQNATNYVTGVVPEGSKTAILNVDSGSAALSDYILEELSALLVNSRKLIVVERKELDLIRQEENFQLSGEVNDETAQRIGYKLGAQTIISGSIVPVGNQYRLRIRALEVETAMILGVFTADVREDRVLTGLLKEGGPPTSPDDWKNKRFYVGARAGLSPGFYDSVGGLFPSATSLNGGLSFNAALYGAVYVISLFEVQVEAFISADSFDVQKNSTYKSVAYTSLDIPLLAKLVWRPAIFMLQGYIGAYMSLPLGQVTIKHSNGTLSADYGVIPGFVVGGGGGVKLGPGVVLGDIRYSGDFSALTATISGSSREISLRGKLAFSLGYEIGLMQK
jgi:TolB-like protein